MRIDILTEVEYYIIVAMNARIERRGADIGMNWRKSWRNISLVFICTFLSITFMACKSDDEAKGVRTDSSCGQDYYAIKLQSSVKYHFGVDGEAPYKVAVTKDGQTEIVYVYEVDDGAHIAYERYNPSYILYFPKGFPWDRTKMLASSIVVLSKDSYMPFEDAKEYIPSLND